MSECEANEAVKTDGQSETTETVPENRSDSEGIEAKDAAASAETAVTEEGDSKDVDKAEVAEGTLASEAGGDEPKADEAKADEAKADEAKADEAKADEAKADEAKADEAKADEAKADDALFETECGQTVVNPSRTEMPRVSSGHGKSPKNKRDIKRQQAEMKRYVYPLDALKKHLRIDIGVMIGAPVLLVIMLIVCVSIGGLLGVVIFLLVLAVLGFVFHNRLMHFRKSVKYSMVFNAINKTFSPEVYLAYKNVDEDILDAAGIVEDWSEAKMSDYFRGTWRGFPFSFGDIRITGHEVNKKLAQTLYFGQLFVIETGLDLKTWITIHERKTMLTPELYEAQKSSDKFFTTGNAQFDRQFEVRVGANGKSSEGVDASAREAARHLVESLSQDMIAADAYVVSRTTMRFEGNYLYLATENARDTFELQRGDLKNLELLGRRFSEEVEAMTIYLDLVTKGLESVKSPKSET
ncbi:MAG: DUF3137 domain-containing protein [Proteobacteria bacterium]|nr:DUF3137 domain-containing protein [Pseudomonadota bacterium]